MTESNSLIAHMSTTDGPKPGSLLPRLPQEILNMIVLALCKEDLKLFRLTSRGLNDLASPLVFEELVLYPHVRSFQQMANISNSPHLAHFIRCFVYDAHWIDGALFDLVSRYEKHESSSEEDFNDMFDQEVDSHLLCNTVQAESFQVTQLSSALQTFINLESITLCGRPPLSPFADTEYKVIPPFYERLVEDWERKAPASRSTELRHHTYNSINTNVISRYDDVVISAMETLSTRIKTLTLCTDLGSMFTHLKWSMTHVLEAKLRDLEALTLFNLGRHALYETEGFHKWIRILQGASNLRYLSFKPGSGIAFSPRESGLRRDRVMADRPFVQSFEFKHFLNTYSELRLTWSSRLYELRLSRISCTVSQLKSILSYCSDTIRVLKLSSMVLCPSTHQSDLYPGQSVPRACWVEMFSWMQKNLSLDRITLSGYFRNSGLQQWYFPPEIQGGLREDLEMFIVHGGQCPIEHFAIAEGYFDLQCPKDVNDVPEVLLGEQYCGDKSFVVDYEKTSFSSSGSNVSGDLSSPEREFDHEEPEEDSGIWD